MIDFEATVNFVSIIPLNSLFCTYVKPECCFNNIDVYFDQFAIKKKNHLYDFFSHDGLAKCFLINFLIL